MKKNILSLLFILGTIFTTVSQEFKYGVGLKGGINYSMGGEIRGNKSNANYWGGTVEGEGRIGFHGGAFLQLQYGKIFVRPELVYSSLQQGFPIPLRENNTALSVETLTVPLLLGYNIFGPIDIYAGPVYSSIINATIEGEQNGDPVMFVQNTPVNVQAGLKFEFRRFGLDVRYEHSLSTAERQAIDLDNNIYGGPNGGANKAWINDARLNQIIVSATFKIFGTGLGDGRRRGGSCY